MAEPVLSLAINGRERYLNSKLIPFRVPRHAAGRGNGDHSALSSVAIVGLGYVGLPTAAALHGECERIIGIDISEQRLAEIAALDADLGEPDRLCLKEALAEGTLELTTDPSAASAADAVIICVPTPVDAEHMPDLAALRGACAAVVSHARPGQVIILTSTTYVGTTSELLTVPLAERGLVAGTDVHVAFSPERIDPGNPDHVQRETPRVVGGATAACTAKAAAVIGRLPTRCSWSARRAPPRRPSSTRTPSVPSRWHWPTSSPTRAACSGSTRSRSRWPPPPSRTVSSACPPAQAWAALHPVRLALPAVAAGQGRPHVPADRAGHAVDHAPPEAGRAARGRDPRGRRPPAGRVTGHRHRRQLQARGP